MNPEMVREGLLQTWRINQEILEELIDEIPEEALSVTLSRKGSRTILDQLIHLHTVRMMWASIFDKKMKSGSTKSVTPVPVQEVRKNLRESYEYVITMLDAGLANSGKIKGIGMDVFTFHSYLISHESHHRGNILLSLKSAGFSVGKDFSYAIWDWKKRRSDA